MSGIGGVDFSSTDRARVQEVLALLKEKGTLDELGIGQVRDAFSDLLFPGFSTIQTTARYFLAVPKILRAWAALTPQQRRKQPLSDYLAEAENQLAEELAENHKRKELSLEGIIGHTLIESGGVARRPSSTYWNGLRVFNIIRSEKSLAEFCREWRQEGAESDAVDSEEGTDDGDGRFESEVKLPPVTRELRPNELTLRLSKTEATFLSTQFKMARGHTDSVAAQLLSAGLVVPAISEEHQRFEAFSVWAANQKTLSQRCRDRITTAQRFSLAVEGAHITFNRLLAKLLPNDKLGALCEYELPSWKTRAAQAGVFHDGAPQEWLGTGVSETKSFKMLSVNFLHSWNSALCHGASQSKLDDLVEKQAIANKPGRSLLVRLPRKASDWYGMKELDYRWPTARRMLLDITGAL
jgi:hypothetical protein